MSEQIDALLTERGLEWAVSIGIVVLIFSIWLRYSGYMKRR